MLSVIELLQLTFAIYRRNFGLYIGYSAWMILPAAFIFLLSAVAPKAQDGLEIAGQIALVVLGVWIWIILTKITSKIIAKEKINTDTLAAECWKMILPVLGITILAALVKIVGFLFLIIPGILFSVWYAFADMEVILNGKFGLEAMTGSRDLVRGRGWRVLWRIVAGPLILAALYFIASTSLIGLTEMLATGSTTLISTTPSVSVRMLGSVTDALAFPLFVIYPVLLYLDLKQEKKTKK